MTINNNKFYQTTLQLTLNFDQIDLKRNFKVSNINA